MIICWLLLSGITYLVAQVFAVLPSTRQYLRRHLKEPAEYRFKVDPKGFSYLDLYLLHAQHADDSSARSAVSYCFIATTPSGVTEGVCVSVAEQHGRRVRPQAE